MLRYLSIKNFALIENCEINFSSGLNIITGETGSGKSILIQAVSILLGGRASIEHIRSGMDEAVMNATIEVVNNLELKENLKNKGILIEDDELIIRRILTSTGKSRSFINGTQVTSKEVNIVTKSLFDFHGQHDGISLLRKNTHLKYLDDFLHHTEILEKLNNIYSELKKTEESLKFLEENQKDKEKRLELLQFEIEEIESADIKQNEDEELKREIKIYENIEKIIGNLEESYSLFSGENGISSKLRIAKNLLTSVSESDNSFNNIANEISDIFYRLEDIIYEIQTKKDHYDYKPGKIDSLIERSETIEKLKRKYGGSIPKINDYYNKAKEELKLIKFSDEESAKLLKKLNELKSLYLSKAIDLSDKRKKGAVILENKVKSELQQLAMADVEFKINIESINVDKNNDEFIIHDGKKINYNKDGIDVIEFLISPNKGEPLKGLVKIASGGELSRIVLALKSVLVEKDTISTMIFDEIDAGIGGKVAISVGKTLKKLSTVKQLICITHLPQIASVGNKNFLIQKNVIQNRTISIIEELNKNLKAKEIARMLSGNVTDISIKHAIELMESMKQ